MSTVGGVMLSIGGEAAGAVSAISSVNKELDTLGGKAESTNQKTGQSFKGLVTSISGVATSAYALYLGYDRVQDMSLQVDKANLTVKTSTEAVEKAQANLTKAVAEFGPESDQAKQATDNLAIAEDRLKLAQDRAANAQESQQQGMMQFALSVIPTAITMVASLTPLLLSATGATSLLGAAQAILNAIMSANPIAIVVLAIAGLVAILAVAYQTCEPFRNAVNALGAAIKDTLGKAFEIIMGALSAFANAIGVVVGAVGGFVSAIGNWWAGLTGTVTAQTEAQAQAVEDSYDRQIEAARKGMADQLAEVETKTAALLATEQSRYDEETKAAVDHWNEMLTPVQTGWDGIIDIVNRNMDEQIATVEEGADREVMLTEGMYDQMIAAINEGIASIRAARAGELDALELDYLKQKQLLENNLESHKISQTTFDKEMTALESTYRDERGDISDDFRIKELEAEAQAKVDITAIEEEKHTEVVAINSAAFVEIEALEGERTKMITEVRENEKQIETTHASNVATITTNSESEKKGIIETGENAINTLVGQKQDDLNQQLKDKGAAMNTTAQSTWDTIKTTITNVFGSLKDSLSNIWTGITNWWGGLSLGAPTVEAPSTTINYSGVPNEPYQSAMYNPVMFTHTTPITAHKGEVIGSPEAILARSGGGGATFITNITGNTISSDVDLEEILDRRDRLLLSRLAAKGGVYPR